MVVADEDWLDSWHFSFDDLPGGPNNPRPFRSGTGLAPKPVWLAPPGTARADLDASRHALKQALATHSG
jgi:hypothetical protein